MAAPRAGVNAVGWAGTALPVAGPGPCVSTGTSTSPSVSQTRATSERYGVVKYLHHVWAYYITLEDLIYSDVKASVWRFGKRNTAVLNKGATDSGVLCNSGGRRNMVRFLLFTSR